jgi:hypothetical protein
MAHAGGGRHGGTERLARAGDVKRRAWLGEACWLATCPPEMRGTPLW